MVNYVVPLSHQQDLSGDIQNFQTSNIPHEMNSAFKFRHFYYFDFYRLKKSVLRIVTKYVKKIHRRTANVWA